MHEACEARLGGTWRAVAVVGVTHQGYEIARYRVRTVAPDEQRGGGGLIDVHELPASEVRRFQETCLDAGPVCTFYAEHGTCKRGARCPYAHVPSARTRPLPEEVAAAIAAAKADRAAAAANASDAPPRADRGLIAGAAQADAGALQRHFFPEPATTRAARDADAFLQQLCPPAPRPELGAAGATTDEERLAEERLEEELAARSSGGYGAGVAAPQSMHHWQAPIMPSRPARPPPLPPPPPPPRAYYGQAQAQGLHSLHGTPQPPSTCEEDYM